MMRQRKKLGWKDEREQKLRRRKRTTKAGELGECGPSPLH